MRMSFRNDLDLSTSVAVFPAGILQPPFYSKTYPKSVHFFLILPLWGRPAADANVKVPSLEDPQLSEVLSLSTMTVVARSHYSCACFVTSRHCVLRISGEEGERGGGGSKPTIST